MDYGGAQNNLAQRANALMREWSGSRKQVSFLLNVAVTRDYETLEIIEAMKSKRTFRGSVIIGLKIVWELRQGRVDTLLAEFPNVRDLLQVRQPPPDDGLRDEIRELKRMMLEQGGAVIQPQSVIMKSAIAPPVAVVTAAVAMDADAIADNFLSMFN